MSYTYKTVVFCYRLVREITRREFKKRHLRPGDAPDLMEKELVEGQRNVCPLRWTKGAIEALHEGTEAYMTGLIKDANLLANHAKRYTVQPRDIQLVRRIKGGGNLGPNRLHKLNRCMEEIKKTVKNIHCINFISCWTGRTKNS